MKKLLSLAVAAVMIAAVFAAFFAVPASASHVLPSEYMELEYIESDGVELIDTGIPVNSKIRLEVTFQIVDPELPGKGSSAGIVGTYIGGGDTTGRFQIAYNRTQDYITMGMGALLVNKPEYIHKDTEKHTAIFDAPAGTFTFDGNLVASIDPANIDINDEHPNLCNFTIGGTNFSKTTESLTSYSLGATKIFYVSFQKDGVMIAEFIPALRIADNYVGMYDTVRARFFENALYDDVPFLADPAVVTTAEATTRAPATSAPVTTNAPVTNAPSTDAVTDAPAAVTTGEAGKTEKKGCGGSAAAACVAAVAVAGCALIRRKH